MSHRINQAAALLAEEIRQRAPLVSAISMADGYAIYFVTEDGRLSGAEYAESARELDGLSLSAMAGIIDGQRLAQESFEIAVDRGLGQAFYPSVAETAIEQLKARGFSTRARLRR